MILFRVVYLHASQINSDKINEAVKESSIE